MNRLRFSIHSAVVLTIALVPSGGPPDGPAMTAFVHVNVLPMDAERVLVDQTVLIEGDRIAAVGPSAHVRVPEGAKVIDAASQWLLPGLADMHVHTYDPNEDRLFIAFGVTTVRNLFGSPRHQGWARGARSTPAPHLLTTAPILDGKPPVWQGSAAVETAEEARGAVRGQHEAGYGWIKVYSKLSREAYFAALDEASILGVPVTGHIPMAVDIREALAAGQGCIEHLDGYLAGMQEPDSPLRKLDGAGRREMGFSEFGKTASAHADLGQLPELIRETRARGVWNTPTLLVYERLLGSAESKKAWFESERMEYVGPMWKRMWDPANDFRLKDRTEEDLAAARERTAVRGRILKALVDGGAPILAGTDAGNPFVWAGYSLHEELARMVEAGLTPYQALDAATAAPARYLSQTHVFGRVVPGLRADLVLLENNPLERIENSLSIRGTMIAGEWHDRAALDELLAKVRALYGSDPD
jgi:hypothetical protein